MNAATAKTVLWLLSLLLGGGMAWYVADYLRHKEEIQRQVPPERMREVLTNIEEVDTSPKVDTVRLQGGQRTVYGALVDHDWTGKPPPPKPVGPEKPAEAPKPTDIAVADLVHVVMFKADVTDDSGSSCVLSYKAAAKVSLPPEKSQVIKYVGDTLDGNLDFITVAAIDARGVTFSFADAERPHETVQPARGEIHIPVGDAEAAAARASRERETPFRRSVQGAFVPERTTLIGSGEYYVGTEEAAALAEDWEMHVSELRTGRHKSGGRYDGIVLHEVPRNSLAARHGFTTGDVIKSINGHAVSSEQEAISFVKQNQDQYDRWVVIIERRGVEETLIFVPPRD